MNDQPKDIFSCNNMPWEGLERLFQEMAGKIPEDSEREIALPDLAAVECHTQFCPDCREHLNELSALYDINESENSTRQKEVK